jgi:hypothetical protein
MKQRNIWQWVTLVSVFNLSGCNENDIKEAVADQARNGYWISQAYGEALHITQDSVMRYQFTNNYCIYAVKETLTLDERKAIYAVDGDQLTQYVFPSLLEGKEDDYYLFLKSENLPESCQVEIIDATADTKTENPVRDLEIFLQTFEQYYHDFDASGVDWTLIEQQARSEVSAQTTRDELFQILSDTIAPLQNGHVGIGDNSKMVSFKRADKPTIYDRLQTEFLTENHLTPPLTEQQNAALVEYSTTNLELIQAASANYLDTSQIKYAANENIIWGKFKSGNYGYLNVLGFSEFTDSTEDYGNMLETMHQAMQQILTDLENTDALVIDLRFNGGGYPFLARALSQYFVSQMQLGYIKSVRYGNYFSPEQFIYISPKAPYYDKPIVVLVSNTTASSAEMATLILAERPNVTLIGESTQGMQSGKQLRVLPNGFIFSLSNIRLLSANREYYEQRGIPADIEATFASKADRTEGKDSGLKAALKWLSQND